MLSGLLLDVRPLALLCPRLHECFCKAFLFVPITMLVYVGVPMEKSNEVSGMINLVRNLGGSVGISLIQTLIAQRSQLHQHRLVGHVTQYNRQYQTLFNQVRGRLFELGQPRPIAQGHALLYSQVQIQASSLAFIDTIWLLGLIAACVVPLVVLMEAAPPGELPAGQRLNSSRP
jgi:DHA2 family multidrug resistance protein